MLTTDFPMRPERIAAKKKKKNEIYIFLIMHIFKLKRANN